MIQDYLLRINSVNQLWLSLIPSVFVVVGMGYYARPLRRKTFIPWVSAVLIVGGILACWYWNFVNGFLTFIYPIGFYVGFFLVLRFYHGQSWRNAIFFGLIHYFATAYVSRIVGYFYKLTGGAYYRVDAYLHWSEPWGYIISGFVTLFILYLIRNLVRNAADFDLNQVSLKEFLCILILAIPIAYFCFYLALLSTTYPDLPFGFVLIRAIISVGAAAALFGYITSRKKEKEIAELKLLQDRLKEQYERHLIKSKSSELIMQKCHDLQKFMHIIKDTCDEPAVLKYEQELAETITVYDTIYETGNPTLDSIISEKSRTCRENQITLICVVDGKLISFMDPIDICAIFGNALDNAIESAVRLSDENKKVIQVKLTQKDFLTFFSFENFYEHDLLRDGEVLLSNKQDQLSHGLGIKSIQYAVGKYGGDVRISMDDGKFKLMALISQ